jgi:hypothetical protein
MDEVVADWMGAAEKIIGHSYPPGSRIPDPEWQKIKSHERFYRDLPIKSGAEELVSYCRTLLKDNKIQKLAFLTAIPHDDTVPYAVWDKVFWADRHFPGIPVFIGPYSFDKYKHCTPGDILIDDRSSNCEEWRAQGGLAHEYRTWSPCRVWLRQVLLSTTTRVY